MPRSASVRTIEESAVLQFSPKTFRSLLPHNTFLLSKRIFRDALRTLIDKEQSLIDSLLQTQDKTEPSQGTI